MFDLYRSTEVSRFHLICMRGFPVVLCFIYFLSDKGIWKGLYIIHETGVAIAVKCFKISHCETPTIFLRNKCSSISSIYLFVQFRVCFIIFGDLVSVKAETSFTFRQNLHVFNLLALVSLRGEI